MTYDLCITAVSERADLFVRGMDSLLANLDMPPSRLIVHEDVRPGSVPGEIGRWLGQTALQFRHKVRSPAKGLGQAMKWCLEQVSTPVVLYTQEDYGAARMIPVKQALEIMQAHGLNHVRFNQRQTMPHKHGDKGRNPNPWRKVEVIIGEQVFCVSDHWYTQTSLWRVEPALEGMRAVLNKETIASSNLFVARFNEWMNRKQGDGVRPWNDQMMRHERLKTYIWGGIGEPAFLTSLDVDASRTTGPRR